MCARDSLISPGEYQKLPEILKKLRELHGETQEELAKAIGLTKSAISNYENRHRTPELNELRALAKHFNLTVHSLLRGECLSVERLEELPFDNPELLEYFLNRVFPFVWLDEDLKNKHFQKAFELSNEMIQALCYRTVTTSRRCRKTSGTIRHPSPLIPTAISPKRCDMTAPGECKILFRD